MSGERIDVVVAGHICLDLIPSFGETEADLRALMTPGKLFNVGPLTTATGGTVSNTGLALRRLGLPARLMGKVGDDLVGRAILDALRSRDPGAAEGMIVAEGRPSSYTIVINPRGVDRIFLHCPGANDTFGADDVDYDEVASAKLFHFGYPPLMRRMYADGGRELQTIFRRVGERGVVTSLDMAYPDPASEAGGAPWLAILERVLPHVDVFLPSFEETLFMLDRERFGRIEKERGGDLISGAEGALLDELAGRLIGLGCAVVGLKLGDQGLYLRTTGEAARVAPLAARLGLAAGSWVDRELLSPCFEVEVAGTTGSGDCTIAGFLAGMLHRLSPEEAMSSAVAVGACNVEQADATSGIPPWEAVQRRIGAGWGRRPLSIPLPGWHWEEASGIWRGPHDGPRKGGVTR